MGILPRVITQINLTKGFAWKTRRLFRSRSRMSVRDALIPVRPICRLHPLTVLYQILAVFYKEDKIKRMQLTTTGFHCKTCSP